MAGLSSEVRKLQNKWNNGNHWPRQLEWLEISGIRGWTGQRVDFKFPIVALVGENGSGKSTVLQAAAAVYKAKNKKEENFASDFFPDTPFEKITGASIRFSYREGDRSQTKAVRKPTDRWRGNPERPERKVEYVDLSRIQPVSARVGYSQLLKSGVTEGAHSAFDEGKLKRLTQIVGKSYSGAGLSLTSAGEKRFIPVLKIGEERYSGFHQGAGEIAATELLAADYSKYGLVLIDEIESSLHPRAQRRLIRDLASIAREKEIQIILSTHSPYVLSELPPEARIYLMNGSAGKQAVTGVSPEFAMTRMDEEQHPECDVFVEDPRAAILVGEILAKEDRDLLARVKLIPYGSASVGNALGQMAQAKRFPRPSVVFLDGDQPEAAGCNILPGDDAPERVVFSALSDAGWPAVAPKVGRGAAETIDALNSAILIADHHDWVFSAADSLGIGGEILWQALASAYVSECADRAALDQVLEPIRDALNA